MGGVGEGFGVAGAGGGAGRGGRGAGEPGLFRAGLSLYSRADARRGAPGFVAPGLTPTDSLDRKGGLLP